jgi:hypothetical protein
MNPEDTTSEGYGRPHQAFQQWAPSGSTIEVSPTGQEFYLDAGAKNAENIRKFSLEAQFRELCPVWKQVLPGGPSIFSNDATPQ